MKVYKAKEIAEVVDGILFGDPTFEIKGIASFDEAEENDLTFFVDGKLRDTRSRIVVIPEDSVLPGDKYFIIVRDVYQAIVKVAYLFEEEYFGGGISSSAIIYPGVQIGKNVVIREFVVVESGVVIEDNVVVMPFVYIGRNSIIGEGTILFPRVTIYPNTVIGKRCRIHAGTVIGSDGFGYVEVEGKRVRIPHLGRVVIEDEVEIGANTTIDRGTFGSTVIGRGTKVDNLVQIAHNVKVGSNCVFAGQVGISGSVKVGNNVMFGGQVGVADHAVIGDNVMIAAKSGVMGIVKSGEKLAGIPAISAEKWKRIQVLLSRLPNIYKKVRNVED